MTNPTTPSPAGTDTGALEITDQIRTVMRIIWNVERDEDAGSIMPRRAKEVIYSLPVLTDAHRAVIEAARNVIKNGDRSSVHLRRYYVLQDAIAVLDQQTGVTQ